MFDNDHHQFSTIKLLKVDTHPRSCPYNLSLLIKDDLALLIKDDLVLAHHLTISNLYLLHIS